MCIFDVVLCVVMVRFHSFGCMLMLLLCLMHGAMCGDCVVLCVSMLLGYVL